MLLSKATHSQFQMRNPGRVRENGRETSEDERKLYIDCSPTMCKIFSISKNRKKSHTKKPKTKKISACHYPCLLMRRPSKFK